MLVFWRARVYYDVMAEAENVGGTISPVVAGGYALGNITAAAVCFLEAEESYKPFAVRVRVYLS